MSQEKLDLEEYQALTPQLERLQGQRATIFMGDDLPEPGEAIALGQDETLCVVRCVGAAGGRRVFADGLGPWPQGLSVGASATRLHKPATLGQLDWSAPCVDLSQAGFSTRGQRLDWSAPGWMELEMSRQPLSLGVEAIDTRATLARGGLHLLVDTSDSLSALEALAQRALAALTLHDRPISTLLIAPSSYQAILPQAASRRHLQLAAQDAAYIYTLRAALANLRAPETPRDGELDALLVLVALPTMGQEVERLGYAAPVARQGHERGYAQLIDDIGSALASTHNRQITTLIHLPLGRPVRDLSHLLETLSLGDVDAQLLLQSASGQPAVDVARSRSKVELEAGSPLERARHLANIALSQAAQLKQRAAMFGIDELEEHEQQRLSLAERYQLVPLTEQP